MDVRHFIESHESPQRKKILRLLNGFMLNTFELSPKIRHKIPFYYNIKWICYLNPISNNGVELAFIHGKQLSNTQGLLQSKGRKQVMGISIYEEKDTVNESLIEIVHEAILLDEHLHKKTLY